MRRILATSLMLPSLLIPAVAKASTPVDDAAASTPEIRISTGVMAPKLLDSANLSLSDNPVADVVPANGQVSLTLTVNEKGEPQDIHVVKSLNPYWDARVLDTVSKFHYKPGTIDNQPIPVDMNLIVNIAH